MTGLVAGILIVIGLLGLCAGAVVAIVALSIE